MKFSMMLAVVGVVISIWCAMGYADRLYTWEDDKGITHITKEPPPQKTKLIDTMDYTVTPAQMNQTTDEQVPDEEERSQQRRIGTQALEETETTEDVDEDVYYDSDGGRYTRRAIRQERKEARENRREDVRPATRERRQFHRRK